LSSQADTSEFKKDPDNIADHLPDNIQLDSNLLQSLQGAASSKDLKDFYQVGLWSYCEGDKDDKTGVETITWCSKSKSNFWFDPFSVWELKDTSAQKIAGDDMQKGLDTYKKVAGWMVWSFGLALLLSVAEFIIGFFAIFSRWGSLITTIVSTVSSHDSDTHTWVLCWRIWQAQTIFIIAAAATATSVYIVLVGVFESVLKPYNINATMGKQMLSVVWLAVAFSFASGVFWLASVCCCSGKSAHKKVSVEKTPYTYERVASPAFPTSGAQNTGYVGAGHGQSGTAYEPFRNSRV
jgi:hypothetical protein